jgi:hypothetical protein
MRRINSKVQSHHHQETVHKIKKGINCSFQLVGNPFISRRGNISESKVSFTGTSWFCVVVKG